jgi:hypothetical protein
MPNKLHYQMLRRSFSGTSDEALELLKSKIQDGSVEDGEPIVIFYDDSGTTGAHLAVPVSGVDAENAEAFIFPSRKEVYDRMDESDTVVTAALIDLDDRISAVTQTIQNFDFSGLNDIVLTENVKVTGTDAGALENGDTIQSGTTFTQFVRKLVMKTLDYTANPPRITSNVSWSPTGNTVEVGTNVEFTLAASVNVGSFTADAANGFPADKTLVTVPSNTIGNPVYTVLSGGTTVNTVSSIPAGQTYADTYNQVGETDFKITTILPYTGVTAASKNLTKNTGETSDASYPSGVASGTTKTLNVRYKAWMGCTSATTAANFNLANATTLVNANGDFLPTSGSKTLVSSSWESDGNNIFILTTGVISKATDKFDVDIKSGFGSPLSFTYTNNGVDTAYHLYIYKIIGGTKLQFKNVTVTR